jgi:hypothetical protein
VAASVFQEVDAGKTRKTSLIKTQKSKAEVIPKPMNQTPDSHQRPVGQFSLMSIFVVTVVFAVLSLCLGYLYRSLDDQDGSMGQFIIVTAMAPLVTLSVISSLFWLFRYIRAIIDQSY